MRRKLIYILAFVLVFSGCVKRNVLVIEPKKTDDTLININKRLVRDYQRIIKFYIAKKGWKMDSTGTGMWYQIYYKTNGYIPKSGDKVTIDYTIRLLNGKVCYSSDSLGPKVFTIDNSAVISGLNDAVQLMPVGSKARFIIPPYRAYGLSGDGDKVPPNSIIICDIYLKNVQRAKSHLKGQNQVKSN